MKLGQRLQAIDKRVWGGMITVTIPWASYGKAKMCGLCNVAHKHRTHHLNIDSLDGTCIVSDGIFESLKKIGAVEGYAGAGPGVMTTTKPVFIYMNEVNDPPTIGLGMGRDGKIRQIRKRQTIHI